MERIRVLVADEHRIFAESLATALAAEQDVEASAAGTVPAAVQPARVLVDGEEYQHWVAPETRIVHHILPDGRIVVSAPKGAVIPEPGSTGPTAPWTPSIDSVTRGDASALVEWRLPSTAAARSRLTRAGGPAPRRPSPAP